MHARMLRDFFSWWLEQMRSLWAPLLNRVFKSIPDALIVGVDTSGAWYTSRRRNGVSTRIGTVPPDTGLSGWKQALASHRRREPVVVRLSQAFLTRETTVPLAAVSHLGQLLRYDMDRLTPFAAAEVFFTHRVRSRDIATGVARVEIAVAPRAWVREPLDRLAALAIRPVALEAPTVSTGPSIENDNKAPIVRIALDPEDPARDARTWRLGSALCGMLALAAFVVPFARQTIALNEVEEQIALLRPRVAQVDELRRRIATDSAGTQQIATARARGTVLLGVLGILTDLMPDDTFLNSLTVSRDRLVLEGHSATATRLIASMTAEPRLKNPSFAAPVVRDENGKDFFTIQAGLAF